MKIVEFLNITWKNMKKFLYLAFALVLFVSCNNLNSIMQNIVIQKFEQDAKSKGLEYQPIDFSEFYAIHFDEDPDSLARGKGLTPMGSDDVYWKYINKGVYISINVKDNPICNLSDIKATAIETDKFIKENGLTANCYFVIHKFKIIDKDLGKNVEYVSGLVVAPPPYEYAGVLYRTIKPWYNQ